MLKTLLVSFIGALIYTAILAVVVAVVDKSIRAICEKIGYLAISFGVEFIWMILFLYVTCKPQTIFTVLSWMWPALIVNLVVLYFFDGEEYEYIPVIVLAVISGTVCLSTIFGPVQNLIYAHDMENVDVTYAISSDEILANVELKIDNSNWKEKYSVDSPEMRKIGEKDVAVYHISDANAEDIGKRTEYIPGYAIQEEGEFPKIVSKRIYFDTSYVNKKDALRTIRRKYATLVIGKHKFDIDDSWNPYMVYEYRENVFSSNGEDYGLIILNLMDGTCEKYPAFENKTPSWVDFKTTYPR